MVTYFVPISGLLKVVEIFLFPLLPFFFSFSSFPPISVVFSSSLHFSLLSSLFSPRASIFLVFLLVLVLVLVLLISLSISELAKMGHRVEIYADLSNRDVGRVTEFSSGGESGGDGGGTVTWLHYSSFDPVTAPVHKALKNYQCDSDGDGDGNVDDSGGDVFIAWRYALSLSLSLSPVYRRRYLWLHDLVDGE
jgi:hypothetical protein